MGVGRTVGVGVGRTVAVGLDVGSAAHAVANKTRNNARPTMDIALRLLRIMYLQTKNPARRCHHCEQRFAVPALLIIDDQINAECSRIDLSVVLTRATDLGW